jgi:hypothetical protein
MIEIELLGHFTVFADPAAYGRCGGTIRRGRGINLPHPTRHGASRKKTSQLKISVSDV